ncbi:hypothetical protein Q5H91_01920 [Sphingomonas sp. KR1UV-12]|uniref:Glycosyltransferase n=1 Tax=Sphingomonas aurea TaxID=3063994 RepID=A0ABT9EH67_9SPHN|nr:hypothetical protein [Sphingomonas sp. KR1UV-12]MDP1025958.1 hypothetical protein [Sphingomonas sp. KR1UV-12]
MHVQIYEPFRGGHHTNYLAALIPSLIARRERGDIDRITVTISRAHLDSPNYAEQLSPFEGEVDFDPSIGSVDAGVPVRERLRLARVLEAAVDRCRPDALVLTTGDHDTLAAAMRPLSRVHRITGKTRVVAMVHAGYAGLADTPASRVKDLLYQIALRRAPWQKLLLVNPLNYEWAARAGLPADQIGVLPDPVPPIAPRERSEARAHLGLPQDGRLVGYVGATDGRKAIPQLIAAFRTVAGPDERLAMIGRLSTEHRALIEGAHGDLVGSGRLVLIDRFLDTAEFEAGLCALDVVAPLHYRRAELSANVLKAVAVRRPIFADCFGYTGWLIDKFALGTCGDVRDPESLATALRAVLDRSATYSSSAAAERLVRFHLPDNYAATVEEAIGLPPIPGRAAPISWAHVIDPKSRG